MTEPNIRPEDYVFELDELKGKAPKTFGVATGTKLDELFFKLEYDPEQDKYVKKPLGGIPYLSVMNVTGIPDTGKSLLVEQFALTQASLGYNVLFVTVESPAEFLYTSLKERSKALGLDFSKLEQHMIVLDASESSTLREDMKAFLDTMAYAIKKKSATVVAIDSITGLYEHKEMMARQIVRKVFNFLKKWRQTAMLVSQKRSSQGMETAEAAGGLAVAHILDGTIVLEKKMISTRWDVRLYGMPIGSLLRLIRIDGCRLAPHATETYVFEITDEGLIDIKMPLKDFIRMRKGGGNGSDKST